MMENFFSSMENFFSYSMENFFSSMENFFSYSMENLFSSVENFLFSLKCGIATWQGSGHCWVMDIVFSVVCGVVLFLLLLPWLVSDPAPPPARKPRNTRKRPVQLRWKRRKKREALQGCRDALQELETVLSLNSLLKSHLRSFLDERSAGQCRCQHAHGELYTTASEGAHRSCGESEEDAGSDMATLGSPPLTEHLLSRASAPSPGQTASSVSVGPHTSPTASQPPEPFPLLDGLEPQPSAFSQSMAQSPPPTASPAPRPPDSTPILPQWDPTAVPLGTVPQTSAPPNPPSASTLPAIYGVGRSNCPVSGLSWRQVSAKVWTLSVSPHFMSPPHPPAAPFWDDPTDRRAETGSRSRVSPDVQNLLEAFNIKRAEPVIRKEGKREASHCPGNSLDNVFESLGSEQNVVNQHPSRLVKDTLEQRLGPEKPPHAETLGYRLPQKDSQLFWGLPSLHSESLVAAVQIAASTLQPPSVIFNGLSHALPFCVQAHVTSNLPLARPLPHPVAQPQLLTSSRSPFQPPPPARIQTQVSDRTSSLPIQRPATPPRRRTSTALDPSSQKEVPSMPKAGQNLHCPLLKKQRESGRSSPSRGKAAQEVLGQLTPNLPQDHRAAPTHSSISVVPGGLISPDLREQLEQHLKRRQLLQDGEHPGVPTDRILELTRPVGPFPGVRQAQGSQGPLHLPALTGKHSQDAEKTGPSVPAGTLPTRDLGKEVGRCVGKILKGLSSGSAGFPGKVLEGSCDESDGDFGRPSVRAPDKNVLRGHLDRKFREIREGQTPAEVHQSGSAASHAVTLPGEPDTQREARHPAPSKDWEPCLDTSPRLDVFNPGTQRVLETQVKKFPLRHRWDLPLQVHKPVKSFMTTPCSGLLTSLVTCSAVCASSASEGANVAELLGEHDQPILREKVAEAPVPGPQPRPGENEVLEDPDSTLACPVPAVSMREAPVPGPQLLPGEDVILKESVLTLSCPPLPPAPAYEKIQKAQEGSTPGDYRGPSKAPPTRQEGRLPSRPLTRASVGRTGHHETAMEAEKGPQEPSPRSAGARNDLREESAGWTPEVNRLALKIPTLKSDSQPSGDEKDREAMEAKAASAWTVTVEQLPRQANSRAVPADMRRSGSPGPRKSQPPPTKLVAQDPREPHRDAPPDHFVPPGLAKAKPQGQGRGPRVLLEDCRTGALLQGLAPDTLVKLGASDVFSAADILASQKSRLASRSIARGHRSASQVPHDHTSRGGSRQQGSLRPQDQDRTPRKNFIPRNERKSTRRPDPGPCKEGLVEQKTPKASGVSAAPEKKSGQSFGTKSFQLEQQGQALPENPVIARMRHFLQGIFPGNDRGLAGPLRKGQPASAAAPSRKPVQRSGTRSRAADPEVLMALVRRGLEEKIPAHCSLSRLESNWRQGGVRAPADPCCRRQSVLSYKEQKRMSRGSPYGHPATPDGHKCPNASRWSGNRDSQCPFPCGEPGSQGGYSQHGLRMAGSTGRPGHCPGPSVLGKSVSSCQRRGAAPAFPGRTSVRE